MSNTTSTNKILFDDKLKKYLFLSNSYCSQFTIDDKVYNHVEGYYQSIKHQNNNQKAAERVRCNMSPILAKKSSYLYKMNDEQKRKWDSGYRVYVMKRALYTKFITNKELGKLLLY